MFRIEILDSEVGPAGTGRAGLGALTEGPVGVLSARAVTS